MKPKIIAVVGPTAAGKSSLATEIAKKFNGEILCVDSRTVYRGMDIGTAKPPTPTPPPGWEGGVRVNGCTPFLLIDGVRHFGLDLVEPNEEMNGALFKEYADKVIADIVSRGKLPVLVGGTGLWFDMIIDNLEMPEVEPDLGFRAELEKRSEDELFAEFFELDPIGAEVIDRKNKRRLIRALEVCKKTGQPFSELRKKGEPKYEALWLGIDLPAPILNERIDRRVDEMIDQGLVDEVKKLTKNNPKGVYALSGIGYQEICQYLYGQISLPEAINKIKLNTKHYAKRQRTWFKKNKNIQWVNDVLSAEKLVSEWL
ncbi:MAG: tRNA (adenosine(37)-N6)-dimethylallyltransferase MiaA [Candidatus Uhrbacteria bacterium]